MSNDYYVYVLKRSNGNPFYVGKGTRDRLSFHEWAAKRGWSGYLYNVIRKIWRSGGTVIHQKIATGLSNDDAIILECSLIKRFGKRSAGGCLVNITDGGDGASGYKHNKISIEKMRKAWTTREPFSEESKAKMRAANVGKRLSEETKLKISISLSGDKHWNFGKTISGDHSKKLHDSTSRPVLVNGVRFASITSAAKYHNICSSTANYRLNSKRKHIKNIGTWEYE